MGGGSCLLPLKDRALHLPRGAENWRQGGETQEQRKALEGKACPAQCQMHFCFYDRIPYSRKPEAQRSRAGGLLRREAKVPGSAFWPGWLQSRRRTAAVIFGCVPSFINSFIHSFIHAVPRVWLSLREADMRPAEKQDLGPSPPPTCPSSSGLKTPPRPAPPRSSELLLPSSCPSCHPTVACVSFLACGCSC